MSTVADALVCVTWYRVIFLSVHFIIIVIMHEERMSRNKTPVSSHAWFCNNKQVFGKGHGG